MDTKQLNKHELERRIASNQTRDTIATNKWLKQQGLNEQMMQDTSPKLLKALKRVEECLTKYFNLLSQSDIKQLQAFRQKMRTDNLRKQLRSSEADQVFKITTRTYRLAYRREENRYCQPKPTGKNAGCNMTANDPALHVLP
jgi:hypothetical protein